jgi:SAM-dependent methyltransferase
VTQTHAYGAGHFDHRLPLEVRRLRALESYVDPVTRAVIEAKGIRAGWRCLELGGGAGSIARWLAGMCAPGEVVVTDLDTRLLPRDVPNLSVLRHDVVHDDFPPDSFDLVHARALLEHLPERAEVLTKMVRWTVPGGWVCVDGVISFPPHEDTVHDAYQRCWHAVLALAQGPMRIDQQWATALPGLLGRAGLTRVGVQCTPGLVGRGGNADAFLRLSLEQLEPALLDRNLVTREDIIECADLLEGGQYTDLALMAISAWGQRPAA